MKERICLLNKNQFLLYDNKVESRKKIEATRKNIKRLSRSFLMCLMETNLEKFVSCVKEGKKNISLMLN